MVASPPRLREDLIISRQELPGGAMYVIKDPAVGRFVRFKEPEFFIAQQFDGLTPFEEIRRRGEEQFGATLSQSTVEQFAGKLQNLGLLAPQTSKTLAEAPPSRSSRFRGNIFYLRFKVFDPDRFLDRAVPKMRFLFTRQFV